MKTHFFLLQLFSGDTLLRRQDFSLYLTFLNNLHHTSHINSFIPSFLFLYICFSMSLSLSLSLSLSVSPSLIGTQTSIQKCCSSFPVKNLPKICRNQSHQSLKTSWITKTCKFSSSSFVLSSLSQEIRDKISLIRKLLHGFVRFKIPQATEPQQWTWLLRPKICYRYLS